MTIARPLILATDGGNTKTLVALADLDGRVVASSRGPASDIYGRGSPETALDVLVSAARRALADAGAEPSDLSAAVWSLAGADWPEDFELLERELAARLAPACVPIVVNDALGGLRSGAPEFEGIAVVCGTYNAVGARNRDGRAFHLGFWPDRAGGFDLGLEALKAVYRHGLDLGPPTGLTLRAMELFEVNGVLELLHAFTRRNDRLPIGDVQRLAPELLDLADRGDAVSGAIVAQAGTWLGDQARVSAARVGLAVADARVVLSGGVIQHPSTRLVEAIMDRLPGGLAIRTRIPPVVGALLLGFDALGQPMEAEVLAKSLESHGDGVK